MSFLSPKSLRLLLQLRYYHRIVLDKNQTFLLILPPASTQLQQKRGQVCRSTPQGRFWSQGHMKKEQQRQRSAKSMFISMKTSRSDLVIMVVWRKIYARVLVFLLALVPLLSKYSWWGRRFQALPAEENVLATRLIEDPFWQWTKREYSRRKGLLGD